MLVAGESGAPGRVAEAGDAGGRAETGEADAFAAGDAVEALERLHAALDVVERSIAALDKRR